MSVGHKHTHFHDQYEVVTAKQRFALYIALILNFSMFLIEMYVSRYSNSAAILADSMDFLADSFNFIMTLYVMNKSVKIKAYTSILKAVMMVIISIIVMHKSITIVTEGKQIIYEAMGIVSVAALMVNLLSAYMFYKIDKKDSNITSAWLCSMNDAINNIMVIIASFLVYYFNSYIPDILAASIMVVLTIIASYKILKLSIAELNANNTKFHF